MKICAKCGSPGPFHKDKSRADGLSYWCKDCKRQANKTRRAINSQKVDVNVDQVAKTCTKCGGHGPFGKDKRHRDGLQSWCRACMNEAVRKWTQANPERVRANQQKWQIDNPERVKEKERKYRVAHPEKIRENNRKAAHSEREYERRRKRSNWMCEYQRLWRKVNPDTVRAIRHRRRARKLEAGGQATKMQIRARIDYYGGYCAYCLQEGKQVPYEHVDHVIPLSKGGSNWPANLRPACAHHNQSKGNKHPSVWRQSQWVPS